MKEVRLLVEVEVDDTLYPCSEDSDPEELDWFYNELMLGEGGLLLLHSNEVGDGVGKVTVLANERNPLELNKIIHAEIKKMVDDGMPNVYWEAEEIMDHANSLLEEA